MKKQKRGYNKINIFTILLILGSIIGILIILGNKPTLSHTQTIYKTIYVSNGETLWEIASREAKNNSYYLGKDVRYIINHIKTINQLKTSLLFPNQELIIPGL